MSNKYADIKKIPIESKSKYLPKLDLSILNPAVRYSFKYFHTDHEDFYPTVGDFDKDGLLELIDRLKNISTMNMSDFMNKYSKSLRNHPISWEQTAIKDGYSHLPFTVEMPFQFEVSLSHGRVHGFIIDTTFYIVWLDRAHRLYPRKD